MPRKDEYDDLMSNRASKIIDIFEEAAKSRGVVVCYEDDIIEREDDENVLDPNNIFGGLRNEIDDKVRGQLFEMVDELTEKKFIKAIEFEEE